MKKEGSLRDRKKANVKRLFIKSATRLFFEKGFDNVSVEDIVERTGVSRSTFFRYFKTKEAVVFRNHKARLAIFREMLSSSKSEDKKVFSAIRNALINFSKYYDEIKDELLEEYQIVVSSPYLIAKDIEKDRDFEEAIYEEISRRLGKDDNIRKKARIFAAALFGTARIVMEEWFEGGCRRPLVKLARESLDILSGGFNW
ncbi:MAG: TetR family transcriptional regulator [Deltaproteobacteria bacterium]|nr:TetR family transcriptional regulator [Deltaproteobacteria bacterium]